MTKPPTEITPARLSVVVMPNGEVICLGKTVGWFKELGRYLTPEQDPLAPLPSTGVPPGGTPTPRYNGVCDLDHEALREELDTKGITQTTYCPDCGALL